MAAAKLYERPSVRLRVADSGISIVAVSLRRIVPTVVGVNCIPPGNFLIAPVAPLIVTAENRDGSVLIGIRAPETMPANTQNLLGKLLRA